MSKTSRRNAEVRLRPVAKGRRTVTGQSEKKRGKKPCLILRTHIDEKKGMIMFERKREMKGGDVLRRTKERSEVSRCLLLSEKGRGAGGGCYRRKRKKGIPRKELNRHRRLLGSGGGEKKGEEKERDTTYKQRKDEKKGRFKFSSVDSQRAKKKASLH